MHEIESLGNVHTEDQNGGKGDLCDFNHGMMVGF